MAGIDEWTSAPATGSDAGAQTVHVEGCSRSMLARQRGHSRSMMHRYSVDNLVAFAAEELLQQQSLGRSARPLACGTDA
jgi:hypothetical protein